MGKRRGKNGEELQKRIAFCLFAPGNHAKEVRYWRAPPQQGFTELAIRQFMLKLRAELHEKYPDQLYKIVKVGPAGYNFVWQSSMEDYGRKTLEEEELADEKIMIPNDKILVRYGIKCLQFEDVYDMNQQQQMQIAKLTGELAAANEKLKQYETCNAKVPTKENGRSAQAEA